MNQFLDINQFLYRIKKSNQFYIKWDCIIIWEKTHTKIHKKQRTA
jgi:hypothetical protein